jgi:hypothetical protein
MSVTLNQEEIEHQHDLEKHQQKKIVEIRIHPKSFLPQDIPNVTQLIAEHFIIEHQSLNPELSQQEISLLVQRIEKRSKTNFLRLNELALKSNTLRE